MSCAVNEIRRMDWERPPRWSASNDQSHALRTLSSASPECAYGLRRRLLLVRNLDLEWSGC